MKIKKSFRKGKYGLLFLISTTLLCSSFILTRKEHGFATLFNGKNFDGWMIQLRQEDPEMEKKVFTVDEGHVIHIFRDLEEGYGSKENINATHGMMWSTKKYSRYIFKFEYKWGKKLFNNFIDFQYDAGFYYHVGERKIWPKGIEYQVRYDNVADLNHTGDFWASGDSTRFQWTMGTNGRFALPKDGGVEVPKKGKEHLAALAPYNALNNKWNQCEIIVMGDKYAIHKLNGNVVNYATNLSLSEGYLGLQSETGEIYYKNIEIKELGGFVPAEKYLNR
ncbi:MAG: DUF1080 domain-containing protein [Chitinophagaceae bacterium]